jgi:hypothetical protein
MDRWTNKMVELSAHCCMVFCFIFDVGIKYKMTTSVERTKIFFINLLINYYTDGPAFFVDDSQFLLLYVRNHFNLEVFFL